MHDMKAVPANANVVNTPVVLPTVGDSSGKGAHTPRALKRPTESGADVPPARRRATPSPARVAVSAGAERIAVEIAAVSVAVPRMELEFRARADATERAHGAILRTEQEEMRQARAVHQQLYAEVRESRDYAALEHDTCAALHKDATYVREESAAARTEFESWRAHDNERAQYATGQAVDKAKSEAERLHALLLRIAESDAHAKHEGAIAQVRAELDEANMVTKKLQSHGMNIHAHNVCRECPNKTSRIEYLEGKLKQATGEHNATALELDNARAEHNKEAHAASALIDEMSRM